MAYSDVCILPIMLVSSPATHPKTLWCMTTTWMDTCDFKDGFGLPLTEDHGYVQHRQVEINQSHPLHQHCQHFLSITL